MKFNTKKRKYSKNKTKKNYSKKYLSNNILFSNKLYLNFRNKLKPGIFLNKFLGYKYTEPSVFYNNFINNLNNYFASNNKIELFKLIKTNKSCNYPLFWQIIIIPPKTIFSFHIHPNIEYDYVVEGKLYEYKLKNKLAKNGLCIDYSHSKIFKNMSIQDFEFNKIEKNEFIINDSGSCHISYTKDEGCILYSLWSGVHIKINEFPSFFKNIT